MRTITKTVKLSNEKYFMMHLNLINPLLPVQLTDMEIKVLGTFMSFTGEVAEKDRFGTSFRNEVKEKLKISTSGLSNYIKSLKVKGAIKEEITGIIIIQPFLIPESDEQSYNFKIVRE